jgi:very-short-patch-repair endonuclease
VKCASTVKRALQRQRTEAQANLFIALCRAKLGLIPTREHHFATPCRNWRFDFAWWPARLVALEVEGGSFAGGRHTRGSGFREDAAKYNHATCLGWRVLRVLPEQLNSPRTFQLLACLLSGSAPPAPPPPPRRKAKARCQAVPR